MKKLIALLIYALLVSGCGGNTAQTPENNTPEAAPPETVTETPAAQEDKITVEGNDSQEGEPEIPEVSKDVVTDEGFDQFAEPQKGDAIAIIKTNMGDIKVKFFADDAPKAVENFLTHSKNGYYDGVTFHRVMDGFMLQGGDPDGTGRGGESIFGGDFEDEFTARLHNYRGALSMANKGPDTNGSQFFIVQAKSVQPELLEFVKLISEYEEAMYPDYRTGQIVSGAQRFTKKAVDIYSSVGGTPSLDGGFPNQDGYVKGHTVFGQVVEGMDVVDAIAAVETDESDKPLSPVIIEKIEVTEY